MKDQITPFQIVILVLSFYVLGALVADLFFALSPELSRLLDYLDIVVCVFFFLDFSLRFHAAPNKGQFMRWGWIDLLASIPAGLFMAGRVVRVIQILRLIRALKSIRMFWRLMFRNRAKGIFASAATTTLLLVALGSMTMLIVESPNPESPIDSAEEALWWAFVTVTTVGYGDYYPITTLGRIVAVLLMIAGVGLFGSFAAYVGSLFIDDQSDEDERQHEASRRMMRHMYREIGELHGELRALREEVRALRDDGVESARASAPPRDADT
ncbi:voltage-gated potassium channel [Modicisalibacter ilicicola DSM 19980]|uniref:Voltage-gated potassium channel n=1 Tax=Modicisalibacter ilicicola DSM 19980 TaxID=1121942 RepID=A0A1M5AY75_9GAMM|nr:ion transporter [Halomonas ilicicola]SHF35106.1 voltage-gated potassium channel [Halomonas ilicicola DSM 19980]